MCIVCFMFGLILLVAQRCVPTIFDVDQLSALLLSNDANISSNLTDITELTLDQLDDIEAGTM